MKTYETYQWRRWMKLCWAVVILIIPAAVVVRVTGLAANTKPAASSCSNRRNFVFCGAGTTTAAFLATACLCYQPQPAWAIPMVSTDEFNILLRDSARSVDRVEFSGPQNEMVIVFLSDGTSFGIKDVVESPTDPRSPLKIAAACNANKIPTRFVDLELALSKTGNKKKKIYSNTRVLEAAEKEKEKALRIQQDEELRKAELAAYSDTR